MNEGDCSPPSNELTLTNFQEANTQFTHFDSEALLTLAKERRACMRNKKAGGHFAGFL